MFDYPTLEKLAGYVVRDVLHLESEAAPEAEAEEAVDGIQEQALAEVRDMSEEEMDALVSEQLARLKP